MRCPSFSVNSSRFAGFWLSLAAVAAVAALAVLPVRADDAKKDGKDAPAETETTDDAAKMTEMLLPGQDVKGMKYAHTDENGKVVMEFDSEITRKIDDENVAMENLKIIAYDEDGKQIKIDLPSSVFNVTTRILTGKERIVIYREDFEIIGETGEFNTKTRFARLLGNVKMTIHNTDNLDQ